MDTSLKLKIISNIEILLEFLGIKNYKLFHNRVSMPCPIHGGDNPTACVIYFTGKYSIGNWKCFTHGCERSGNTLFDFINLISPDSIYKISKLYENIIPIEKEYKQKSQLFSISEQEFIKRVKIPSSYYINRGFSKHILKKYKVGFCNNPKSAMYLRTVVPIYDDNEDTIVGVTGRSVFEKCIRCQCFHSPNITCPEEEWKRGIYCKWKNSVGFTSENNLYNYWNAKRFIDDTVILVEGQADVWKLEEAGIKIGMGLFGCFLKKGQHIKLKNLGVRSILMMTDEDIAGKEGYQAAIRDYGLHYKITRKPLPLKDIGSMSIKQIQNLFVG